MYFMYKLLKYMHLFKQLQLKYQWNGLRYSTAMQYLNWEIVRTLILQDGLSFKILYHVFWRTMVAAFPLSLYLRYGIYLPCRIEIIFLFRKNYTLFYDLLICILPAWGEIVHAEGLAVIFLCKWQSLLYPKREREQLFAVLFYRKNSWPFMQSDLFHVYFCTEKETGVRVWKKEEIGKESVAAIWLRRQMQMLVNHRQAVECLSLIDNNVHYLQWIMLMKGIAFSLSELCVWSF